MLGLVVSNLDVAQGDTLHIDRLEFLDLRIAGIAFCVLVQKRLDVIDGIVDEVPEMPAHNFDIGEDVIEFLSIPVDVKAGDPPDLDLEKFLDILVGHVAGQLFPEGSQPRVHGGDHVLVALLLFNSLVDAVLDEELREGLFVEPFA